MFEFIKLFVVLVTGMLLLVGSGGSSGGGSDDTTPPVITLKGKPTVTIEQGTKYTDAGATAKDDVDGVVEVTTSDSVDTSKVGTYTITYTATDEAGNEVTKKRVIKVVPKGTPIDNTPPVITLKGEPTVTIEKGKKYTDVGATARDDVDGVVEVITSGRVDTSKVGTYTITYTATDKAGNVATKKRTVKVVAKTIVVDKTAPVITLKGKPTVTIEKGKKYTDAGATAKDNVDGTVKVIKSGSVDTSTLGEYTITYTATDKAGNKATATRKVKVTLPPDTVAPVITIIGDNPLEISQGETFSDPGATAKDDRDGVVIVIPIGEVDMSTVGSYIITYTAKDKAGNEANATRTVIVKRADVVRKVSNIQEFREALEKASANGENDRIVLAKGTYNVTSDGLGTLEFDDDEEFNLTIQAEEGLTFKDVILDGNNSTQVFNFDNKENSTLVLKNISVVDGNSSTNGGGVYSNQNMEVLDCNISNNVTSSNGGGVYSSQNMKVLDCNISNNRASYNGGGFYSSGTTKVINSTIFNNHSFYYRGDGGGFFSNSETIIDNSTISKNSSGGHTGAFSARKTTINNSTISNNRAVHKSGGFSVGELELNNSIVSNNIASSQGGFSSWGNTRIINSIISNNHADNNVGGFSSYSTTTITNSTITNNSANKGESGGFFSDGKAVITNSTISNNSANTKGGGFYVSDTIILTNSIISNNSANIGASFYSASYGGYPYPPYTIYVSNNTFVGNSSSIYAKGIFVNNIFDLNDEDITLKGDSKIYNNYIDYSEIEDNGHNVIKKHNLQPTSVGDVNLNEDNETLESDSPVIDKGLNPSSATYKKIIGNDSIYNQMLELLKTDKVGNKRVHNGTIDMGAVEFGSSK